VISALKHQDIKSEMNVDSGRPVGH